MNMLPPRIVGVVEAILSGIGFGFLGVFVKKALESGIESGEGLAMRFAFAAIILWLFVFLKNGRLVFLPMKEALICILLGVFGYAVFSFTYFASLEGLSASLAVLILYTYPVIVTLAGWLLFGLRPSNYKLILMPIMMSGLFLLVWGEIEVSSSTSLLFAVASAVLYATYIVISSRKIAHLDPLLSVTYIITAAGAVLALIYLRDGTRIVGLLSHSWLLILSMTVVCTVLPMLLFLRALQKLPASSVSMLSTTEPITGVFSAGLILGEVLGAWQIVGAVVMIVTLFLIARERAS